ncbi:MAG: hydrogenase 3 maturation endopeptidase HyCI [Anaerolineae bacterium]|nr:hydrogenase 3 maturation endopeptidase HyCI [Anaerolineae bacterium]
MRRPDGPPRLAVVGIGHELRGDDAAGVVVARNLVEAFSNQGPSTEGSSGVAFWLSDWLLVVDAGPAPENCTGPLRRFEPDLVLLVDAAQMGTAPGEIRWLTWEDVSGLGMSTHMSSLRLLAGYLAAELGCEVALIGIQPADDSLGAPLSPAVRQAVEVITEELLRVWRLSDEDNR